MATWLNALLSGACTFTVYRDGVEVTDLAAVGASLSTTGGTVSLTTPGAENHTWGVVATPSFLQSPTSFRMKAFSLSAGLSAAAVQLRLNGASVGSATVLAVGPPVVPDTVTFSGFGDGVLLNVTEV